MSDTKQYILEINKNQKIKGFSVHFDTEVLGGQSYYVPVDRVKTSAQPEPCEDAVSRAEAIRICKERGHDNSAYYIEQLPSVTPERKTGHWLIREGISDAQCSECGMYFNDVYDMENSDAFCRHCGTKMEGLKVVKNE